MKIKILLIFLLISNVTLALEEIPLITIPTPNNYFNQQNSNLINIPTSSYTISAEQIKSSGANSLTNILNATNATQVINPTGSGRTTISMRGFGDTAANNTLILIDGQPYINPDIGAPILNTIPLNEIARIETIPLSGSILYGDQAVGGMVNIITKKPQKNSYQLSATYGSFKTYRTQFIIKGVKKEHDFSYQLGGLMYTSNNYRRHNLEKIKNFNIGFEYQNIYLNYRKLNQHLELPGSLTKEQAIHNPRQAEDYTSHNNQDHNFLQLGLKHQLTPNWLINIDSHGLFMDGKGAYKTYPFNERRKSLFLRPKISGTINLKKFSILPTIGADLNHGKYKFNLSENTQNQRSFYTQIILPFTPIFSTALGTRHSQAFYNLTDGTKPKNKAWVTVLSLKWQLRNFLSLFIRRAENYRFPKTDEITYTIDKKPLKTQTGTSYEAGLSHKNIFFTSSLTLYQLDLKNEILLIPQSSGPAINANLDPTRRIGAIANLNLTFIKQLQLKTNYNFINAKFLHGNFKGKKIPFVASHNLRITGILKPHKNIQFLFEGIYTGKRYQINDVKNQAEKIGGFTVYNCAISFHQKHFTISLRGNNLTNKRYYNYVVYSDSQSSGHYPAAGFNVLANLSIAL